MSFMDDLLQKHADILAVSDKPPPGETARQRAAREARAIAGRYWGKSSLAEMSRDREYRRKTGQPHV